MVICGACVMQAVAFERSNCEIAKRLMGRLGGSYRSVEFMEELRAAGVETSEFTGFENGVLRYFELSPVFRRVGDLALALNIPELYARPLILFYNLDDLLSYVSGEGLRTFSYFRQGQYVRQNLDRLRFYYRNITRLSVAEMARELGIPEARVYKELWVFDISIESRWRKLIDNRYVWSEIRERAQHQGIHLPDNPPVSTLLEMVMWLRSQNVATPDILATLNIGADALSAVLHYLGVEPRGESWSEIEIQQLMASYHAIPVADIAVSLERTEASVSAMAGVLDLRNPVTQRVMNVNIAAYGDIKIGGLFQRDALMAFLFDHMTMSNQELADVLGCSSTLIRQWKLKLGLFTPNMRMLGARPAVDDSLVRGLRGRYEQQEEVVRRIISYLAGGGNIPNAKTLLQTTGVSYPKATATGDYVPGKNFYHKRIFDTTADMWIAIARRVETRMGELETKKTAGTLSIEEAQTLGHLQKFSIFDIKLKGEMSLALLAIFDAHRVKYREELVQKIVAHLAGGGNIPNSETLFQTTGVSYAKATATSNYALGGRLHHQRIFDTTVDMWVAVARGVETRMGELETRKAAGALPIEEVQALGHLQKFNIFDIKLNGEMSLALLAIFDAHRVKHQGGLVQKIVAHLAGGGNIPNSETLFQTTGVSYAKATAQSSYAPGKMPYHQRIFDSTTDMWRAVHVAATTAGLPPNILDALLKKIDEVKK